MVTHHIYYFTEVCKDQCCDLNIRIVKRQLLRQIASSRNISLLNETVQ